MAATVLDACAVGKSKKKERRAQEREERRQREVEEKRRNRRRQVLVWSIPLVTGAAAAGAWFYLENKAATGAIILGGAMIWLLAGLGFIGSGVTPRDRIRAGSIDFGRKRK